MGPRIGSSRQSKRRVCLVGGAASSKVGQKEIGEHISETFGKSRNVAHLYGEPTAKKGALDSL